MSTIRDPAYITDAGRTMMTAGGDVTYTKAVLYGQDISHLTSDQVKALTTIGSPLREVKVGISDKQNTDRGTTVILEATFQNDNLANDLPYTAVGFFAQKGNDEKLIAVAVANTGAYLTATSPDGIATDALDLKLAIAIGDATNVTATVDPAGSVTPATLNGAINKATHDLTAQIATKADKTDVTAQFATKADKTTVEQELAIKANSTDIDKKLATKANSSDVYTKKQVDDAFSSRDATIATKADKATVDAEISKIDFTPYAKTADVTAQINAVSDEIATKVGADYSYSKAQLDEKLLALSTDTNGKVSADQVTALIADKANKADVDKSFKAVNDTLATKADQATTYSKTDVDKLLSAKDDTTDVDAKIKTVTDLANTKASQNSLNKLSQAVDTKADKSDTYTKAEVDSKVTDAKNTAQASTDHLNIVKADKSNTYTKAEVDSRVNEAKSTAQSSDNQIWGAVNQIMPDKNCPELPDGFDLNSRFTGWRRSPNKSLKNMPSGWTTDSMYFQGAIDNNDGLFELALNIGFNTNDCPRLAYRIYAWSNWKPWKTIANDEDIASLQTQINARLPLAGGNMNLRSTINWNGGGINDRTGNLGGLNWAGGTDWAKIYGDQDDNDNLDLAIDLGDDGSNHVSFRKNGSETSAITSDGHFTGTVDWGHVNGRPQDQVDRVNTITPLFRQIQNSNNWNDIFGVGNPNNVLTSLRIDYGGSGALLNNFAAGIGFGGGDTKGVLSVAYSDHQARITGGNGTGPVWSEDVAWKSDVNDLRNQVQQLRESQFEVQTFTDATAAANWEAQRPGHRLAIIQS